MPPYGLLYKILAKMKRTKEENYALYHKNPEA
jgi:hypothetical protein